MTPFSKGPATEVNFDAVVGPTHHYAGLSQGNLASVTHQGQRSNPRAAALEGLGKMRRLHRLGIPQAVLPPLPRPHLGFVAALGKRDLADLTGHPDLLSTACSASSMWTANAATVTPSEDTADGRLHLTVANLAYALHRSLEAPQTHALLSQVFAATERFVVHPPLPAHPRLGDEGAANHTRLTDGDRAVHLFVYGKPDTPGAPGPQRFAARQTRLAQHLIAERHQITVPVVYAQQAPRAIDAGVFHNDVIAVGADTTLMVHEAAFERQEEVLGQVAEALGPTLQVLTVPEAALSLKDAVQTYLFNAQLVRPPGQAAPVLIAPAQCETHTGSRAVIEGWLRSGDLAAVHYVDLAQSMRNGGGPACLRLRVPLTEAERVAMHRGVWFTEALADDLEALVQTHYRESLTVSDLAAPGFAEEAWAACAAIYDRLGLTVPDPAAG